MDFAPAPCVYVKAVRIITVTITMTIVITRTVIKCHQVPCRGSAGLKGKQARLGRVLVLSGQSFSFSLLAVRSYELPVRKEESGILHFHIAS